MDSGNSSSTLTKGSIGEAESDRLSSEDEQKTDSSVSLIIPVHWFKDSINEAESNQPSLIPIEMGDPFREMLMCNALIEPLKRELGIFVDYSSWGLDYLPRLRVPEHIKQLNPDAYKPRLISIGPVHHGLPELQPMETFKRRYAHNFIQRYSINIEKLIEVTMKNKEELRTNYGIRSFELDVEKFVLTMCIDAAFLMEFLLMTPRSGSYNGEWNNVISDLFLLENQIPFDYLSELLDLMSHIKQSVLELCDNFLDNIRPFHTGRRGDKHPGREKHLLDRLRTRMAHTKNEEKAPRMYYFDPCPAISQLHRAGIKFRPSTNIYSELIFQRGTLKIPQFTIDHNTGRYFANLVASEFFADDSYASSYIKIMDCLIDGPEDVRILVERGILENYLEDEKAAARLINETGRSTSLRGVYRYGLLAKGLNEHCEKGWATWRATYLFEWKRELKSNYFGNPWKTLSVIAAVILLALTAAQTVFSFFQLKGL